MKNTIWLPRIAFSVAFVAVLSFHVYWVTQFPDTNPAQGKWLADPSASHVDWASAYFTSGSYWLGYSYALSLAFAAFALIRYLQNRQQSAGRFALGGVGLSGFLSVAGCFLVGCCGSPMLGVYMSLFGASFLPFAKPLVAGVTTIFIILSWWRLRAATEHRPTSNACTDSSCNCQ